MNEPDDEAPVLTHKQISDLQSEASLLGACLLSPEATTVAMAIITPDDFYRPANGAIFEVITSLHEAGEGVDPVTVASELRRKNMLDMVGGQGTLIDLQVGTPAISNASKYAKNIARFSDLRRIHKITAENVTQEIIGGGDPVEIIEATISELREIGAGRTDSIPHGVSRMADFLARPAEQRPDWVIPGIVRVGWRVILTATEGAGKTYLLRQLAASAAAGIHGFSFDQIPPKRVLLVDLENPAEHIDNSMEMIQQACEESPSYNPDNFWLWHAPEGINLRSRADRAKFDNLLREVRPDLVCLGPIYKSYHLTARETDEIAVREVQATLDDFRTRHQFGLIMEHHAAKASGGSKRSLDPYGTVFWMRWPELGIGMEAREDTDDVLMGRWRGDRLPNSWPETLYKAKPWPWAGRWPNNQFNGGAPVLSTSAPAAHRAPRSDEF